MDEQTKNELKQILREIDGYVDDYKLRSETGNSTGEHKEWYRGKHEAYSRCSLLMRRFLVWNGIIKPLEDG